MTTIQYLSSMYTPKSKIFNFFGKKAQCEQKNDVVTEDLEEEKKVDLNELKIWQFAQFAKN